MANKVNKKTGKTREREMAEFRLFGNLLQMTSTSVPNHLPNKLKSPFIRAPRTERDSNRDLLVSVLQKPTEKRLTRMFSVRSLDINNRRFLLKNKRGKDPPVFGITHRRTKSD